MLIAAKLTVDIAGTIVTLQAFGKVVGQIADEDFPSEEGLLTALPFTLIYDERNVIVLPLINFDILSGVDTK